MTNIDIQKAREYIATERSDAMIVLTKNEWCTIQRDFINMHRHIKETDDIITELKTEIQRLNRINANSVSKMELDTCRSLNKALREDNVRLREEIEKLRSKKR